MIQIAGFGGSLPPRLADVAWHHSRRWLAGLAKGGASMQWKGRPLAQPKEIERATQAAQTVLEIVGKLMQAVGYYFGDDFQWVTDNAMGRAAADLRDLRLSTQDLFEELHKHYVSNALDAAAVRLRLPAAQACELQDVSAHRLMALVGLMAQRRIPNADGDKSYLQSSNLDEEMERELRHDLLGALTGWREMGQIDSQQLGVRLRQESLEAIERAELNLAARDQALKAGAVDPVVSQPAQEPQTTDAMQRLLRLYTGNVADERFNNAVGVLASNGTVNEKLVALHRALPIPLCSAQALADALGGGIARQAVAQSAWWKENRAGQQDEVVEARRNRLRAKGEHSDGPTGDE